MYDHRKKAGNEGDVVKHPALIAAVDSLLAQMKGQAFHFIDMFAGYAHNPIMNGNEWRNGIGHIRHAGRRTGNPHVRFWMAQWDTGPDLVGSVYPGSSLFVLRVCQTRGVRLKASLFDISPGVVAQLEEVYDGLDVQIHARSAKPGDFNWGGIDFVFIDPPGIQSVKNPESPVLKELLPFLEGRHNVLMWLPMMADMSHESPRESANSASWRKTLTDGGLSATSVQWHAEAPVCGCQLFYRLPSSAVIALREAIEDVISLMDWDMKCIKHIGLSQSAHGINEPIV